MSEVEGRFPRRTEVDGSWRKVSQPHKMLSNVDERSLGCTISWRRVNMKLTYVNFLCIRETYRQLSLWPEDLTSTSVILPCGRPFVNFLYSVQAFCQLPSTFCAAGRPSVNFLWLYVWPGELSTTSANFLCSHKTYRQLSLRQHIFRQLSAQPGDLPSGQVNFCQLLSTFHVAGRSSIKFRNFLCRQVIFHQLPSIFRVAGRPFINFRPHPCCRGIYCQLPSTLRTSKRPLINILWGQNTFNQLSVRCAFLLVGRLLCTYDNFIYSWKHFRRILSNFLANGRHSVNFCQLSLRSGDLPLITEGLLATQKLHGRWRKVLRLPEIWQKIFWLNRKLSEVDENPPGGMKMCQMLTEGLPAAQKVYRSLWKVCSHTEVEATSSGCTKKFIEV